MYECDFEANKRVFSADTKFFACVSFRVDKHLSNFFLCIFDSEEHTNFGTSDENNLQCAADLLSDLLQSKKPNGLIENGNIHLAVADMMHNIRTPLTAIVIASEILQKDKNTILSSMTSALSDDSSEEENALVERFQGAIETLSTSINELKSSVESHLHIDLDEHPSSHAIHCNILDTIRSCHSILLESFDKSLIEWSVDDTQLSLGTHISYPDVIKYLIITATKSYLSQCLNFVTVNIRYSSPSPTNHNNDNNNNENSNNSLQGVIIITISSSSNTTTHTTTHDQSVMNINNKPSLLNHIISSSSMDKYDQLQHENESNLRLESNYSPSLNDILLTETITDTLHRIGGHCNCRESHNNYCMEYRIPCCIKLSKKYNLNTNTISEYSSNDSEKYLISTLRLRENGKLKHPNSFGEK